MSLVIDDVMSRVKIIEFINKNIDKENNYFLEIGALHNPWLKDIINPNNIRYLDFTTTEQLQINYKNDPNVDITKIVNVDYILDSSKIYSEYINEKFNLVFSSHNIEHQPDIITHLNNVESILVD